MKKRQLLLTFVLITASSAVRTSSSIDDHAAVLELGELKLWRGQDLSYSVSRKELHQLRLWYRASKRASQVLLVLGRVQANRQEVIAELNSLEAGAGGSNKMLLSSVVPVMAGVGPWTKL